jgi:transposase
MSEKHIGQILENKISVRERKPGRPRAIPPELEPIVVEIYHRGYGYRAITRILSDEYHVSPDYTTVKRVLKRLGMLDPKS